MTQTQLLFNIANLIFYAFAGIGAFVLIFKRNKPLAEEVKEALQECVKKKDHREDLKALEERWEKQCVERNGKAVKAYAELFSLDRKRESELGAKLDAINKNLSDWQRTIENKLGNHDGRINNIESKL